MKTKTLVACFACSLLFVFTCRAEPTLEWTRPLQEYSQSYRAATDGLGNVYISGEFGDAILAKFNATGTLQWQSGTGGLGLGVSVNGSGNVYVAGRGSGDADLAKFDSDSGTLQWTRQLGTSEWDVGQDVSADGAGNVYIAGSTGGSLGGPHAGEGDAFVAKYDDSGTLQWTRQLGTSASDSASSVSADGQGNVYIAGSTGGSLGGPHAGGQRDMYVAKYDASGALQWIEQFGTNEVDWVDGISADRFGNVFIAGVTGGSLWGTNTNEGGWDVCVANLDPNGSLQWSRQLGTSSTDAAEAVSTDGLGNVYIAGFTKGSLGGSSSGEHDAFVGKFVGDGALQWLEQFQSYPGQRPYGLSADRSGNVFVSGTTQDFDSGVYAGFVAKFVDLSVLGDYSDDGFVGQRDLDLVLLNWGNTVPPDSIPDGWVNDPPNGLIGQMSLDKVLLNWGKGTPPWGTVSIPEPGTNFLLILGAGWRAFCHSRRRHIATLGGLR